MKSFEERAREEELIALAKTIYALQDHRGRYAIEAAARAFLHAEVFFDYLKMREDTKRFEKESSNRGDSLVGALPIMEPIFNKESDK